jgi:hypothetical protein
MDKRLEQALRTLRAIRQRYETGRDVDSGYIRSGTVQIALGYADMLWITATIEALEKAMRETNPAISGLPQAAPAVPINVTEPRTTPAIPSPGEVSAAL